jgi:hypothetical protein
MYAGFKQAGFMEELVSTASSKSPTLTTAIIDTDGSLPLEHAATPMYEPHPVETSIGNRHRRPATFLPSENASPCETTCPGVHQNPSSDDSIFLLEAVY